MADCVGLVDELDGDDGFGILDGDCFLDAVIHQSQRREIVSSYVTRSNVVPCIRPLTDGLGDYAEG